MQLILYVDLISWHIAKFTCINFSGFFEGSLVFSTLTRMSSVNKDIFTSFLICVPFISLSFYWKSRISNKMLIEVVKVDILTLLVVSEESIQYFTIRKDVNY